MRARRGGSTAAVCRDESGNYIGSSALVVEGIFDPPTLEVIACREALSRAEDLGIHQFTVASDCRQVVLDFNRRASGVYGAVISEINTKASTFSCTFSVESRAVNYEAHSLAKFSLTRGSGQHVWFDAPQDQRCIPHHVDLMNKLGFTPKKI